jgi:hypothetical protein
MGMNRRESAVVAALRSEADGASQSVDMARASGRLQARLERVDRRRGRIRLGVVAAGAVAAAVIVAVVVAGRLAHQASRLSPSEPSPTEPSPTGSMFSLAQAPLLTDTDLSGWQVRRDLDTAPPQLSTCVSDPRTWGAAQAVAATYSSRPQPGYTVNEFVLRFTDLASAHRALLNAWTGLTNCPRQPSAVDDSVPPPITNGVVADEYFATQRSFYSPDHMTAPYDVYATRIARAGNIVVIIEDTGIPSDRPSYMLRFALQRAIPGYTTAYPDGAVPLEGG